MAGAGRRGPAPKPTERKRAAGNPGHQKLPVPAAVIPALDKPPAPPETLTDHGREVWVRIWGSNAKSWLALSEYDLIRLICEAMEERVFLRQTVAREGATFVTEKGYLGVHPALSELRKLDAQITTWMSLAGLTTSDRSRLGLAEVKGLSKLAQLRSKSKLA